MTALPAASPFGIPAHCDASRALAGVLHPVVTDLTALRDRTTGAVTMYRVVGVGERRLLEATDMTQLSPRNEWGVIVMRFADRDGAQRLLERAQRRFHPNGPLAIVAIRVERAFAERARVELDGRAEYWVDTSRLDELNASMRGRVRVL